MQPTVKENSVYGRKGKEKYMRGFSFPVRFVFILISLCDVITNTLSQSVKK